MATTPEPVRELDVDTRSIVAALLAVGLVLLVGGVAAAMPRTLLYTALGVFLALALDPLVVAVRRRTGLGRRGGVAVVLVGFVLALVLLALFVVPPAVRESRALGRELPAVVADLGNLPFVGETLERQQVPERLERWIDELPERLSVGATPLERVARSVADGAVAATAILLVAVALLLDGEDLVARVRRLVPPVRRARVDHLAAVVYRSVGRYAAGSVLVAGIAGVSTLVAGLVLGVPLTPLAAVWVAVWDLVPQIGGAVGGLPFVLLGFSQGVGVGLAALAFFVVYLQVENHVISPLVVGQAIQLSPLATMIAALVGVAAGGVVGALVAVPLTGAVRMILAERRREAPEAAPFPTDTAGEPKSRRSEGER